MGSSFFEKASSVATVAGFGFYMAAFGLLGVLPWLMTDKIAPVQSGRQFEQRFLPAQVPLDFRGHYKDLAAYRDGLYLGKKVYIAEGCWHCHTQYVRPVGNEAARYGPVSENWEYQNEMNLPQLFGTRRVGPDLIREYNKHSTDWHIAHFRNPTDVVPESVMPSYDWFFNSDGSLNDRGWAIVAYVQWLGSWRELPANKKEQG
ncbi:MAG: cbb3-type cytochrome c oxidase subunit II [Planctomycetes bacterium]|nr:cbb3-type cytochrome c oxidase subunit II [Planctomycetota bacterium]